MTKDSGEFSNVANRFKEKGGGGERGGREVVIFYTRLWKSYIFSKRLNILTWNFITFNIFLIHTYFFKYKISASYLYF